MTSTVVNLLQRHWGHVGYPGETTPGCCELRGLVVTHADATRLAKRAAPFGLPHCPHRGERGPFTRGGRANSRRESYRWRVPPLRYRVLNVEGGTL